MRSQKQILDKIDEIEKCMGVDPEGYQRRVLITKLQWNNAKKFLPADKWNEEFRKKWRKKNRLDDEFLRKQLEEQIDYTVFLVSNEEPLNVFSSLQSMFVIIWLFGEKYDNLLKLLVPEIFTSQVLIYKKCAYKALEKTCKEFGFNWKLYKARYLDDGGLDSKIKSDGKGSIIINPFGDL